MDNQEAASFRSASQRISIRVVEGFSELSAEERLAWDALVEEQSGSLPFQSLSWAEAWWQVFDQPSRITTKTPLIFVLSRRGEIIAFFPMVRVVLSVLGLALLRYVKPVGNDANLTELKPGIVREGCERQAYAALVSYFKDADSRWELINLPAVPAGLVGFGDEHCVEHPTAALIEGFRIALPDDWPAFQRGLKRNVKEDIRRCFNRLKSDGIEPVFACLSDSAAIRAMLPEFYRLHSQRAGKEDGIYHPDYFQSNKARSLMDRLTSDPASTGIRLFVLKHGERPIAARLAFETPRSTYLYYSGYDLEYGKYNVMTRLVVEVVKRSIACGQQYVHLSFGRDRSKTRWSPEEVAHKQCLLIQNSLRGRLLGAYYLSGAKNSLNTKRHRTISPFHRWLTHEREAEGN
jgi:CelD/BcsL family acetyltransferase involved in cellulose biosynthesis